MVLTKEYDVYIYKASGFNASGNSTFERQNCLICAQVAAVGRVRPDYLVEMIHSIFRRG
jgi:hypothetical protein